MDWNQLHQTHQQVADFVCEDLREPIEAAASAMIDSLRGGGKILLCGNGGSAADAQHFAAELVNRFLLDREPYAALALTTDSSVLTSIANDFSKHELFSKQVTALGRPRDVLVAISTSGNSSNVVNAVKAAREREMLAVGLLGGSGGPLLTLVDHPLTVSVTDTTARIQEGHLIIIHALCEIIEHQLANNKRS